MSFMSLTAGNRSMQGVSTTDTLQGVYNFQENSVIYGPGAGTKISYTDQPSKHNILYGHQVFANTTNAQQNIAFGYQAGYLQQPRSIANLLIGYQVAYLHQGNHNLMMGNYSGYNMVGFNSSNNTFIGHYSANSLQTSTMNVFLGYNAARNLGVGNFSTYIGAEAGSTGSTTLTRGSLNTAVGYSAQANGGYTISLGSEIVNSGTQTTVIGNRIQNTGDRSLIWIVTDSNSTFHNTQHDYLNIQHTIVGYSNAVTNTYDLEIRSDRLSIQSLLTFSNDITLAGRDLYVTHGGTATFNDRITVHGTTFLSDAQLTGILSAQTNDRPLVQRSNLTVLGVTSLSNALNVTGPSRFYNPVTIQGVLSNAPGLSALDVYAPDLRLHSDAIRLDGTLVMNNGRISNLSTLPTLDIYANETHLHSDTLTLDGALIMRTGTLSNEPSVATFNIYATETRLRSTITRVDGQFVLTTGQIFNNPFLNTLDVFSIETRMRGELLTVDGQLHLNRGVLSNAASLPTLDIYGNDTRFFGPKVTVNGTLELRGSLSNGSASSGQGLSIYGGSATYLYSPSVYVDGTIVLGNGTLSNLTGVTHCTIYGGEETRLVSDVVVIDGNLVCKSGQLSNADPSEEMYMYGGKTIHLVGDDVVVHGNFSVRSNITLNNLVINGALSNAAGLPMLSIYGGPETLLFSDVVTTTGHLTVASNLEAQMLVTNQGILSNAGGVSALDIYGGEETRFKNTSVTVDGTLTVKGVLSNAPGLTSLSIQGGQETLLQSALVTVTSNLTVANHLSLLGGVLSNAPDATAFTLYGGTETRLKSSKIIVDGDLAVHSNQVLTVSTLSNAPNTTSLSIYGAEDTRFYSSNVTLVNGTLVAQRGATFSNTTLLEPFFGSAFIAELSNLSIHDIYTSNEPWGHLVYSLGSNVDGASNVPLVAYTNEIAQRKVIGVVNRLNNDDEISLGHLRFQFQVPFPRVWIRTQGLGMIWVCDLNYLDNSTLDFLEIGDLLMPAGDIIPIHPSTNLSVLGFAVKQQDFNGEPLRMSYTVAKMAQHIYFGDIPLTPLNTTDGTTYDGTNPGLNFKSYKKALVRCVYLCG